jgi:hypothetical protein
MATASYLLFRNGRYLTWARLGSYPGFEATMWTDVDGMPVAEFDSGEAPQLGEFLCQVNLEVPE